MNHALYWFIVLVATSMMLGCSSAPSKNADDWIGYTESGEASFYADKHQFLKTANGETYSHDVNTAAHRTLPFGSTIKVTNVENGKSVVVRVNDRGPFVKGRIVDLSKSAFSRIGNTSQGLLSVELEVIE